MATVSITVPDAVANRVADAIANTHGYEQALAVTPNLTKLQFVKKVLADYVKNVVVHYEASLAQTTQETTTKNEVVIS